MSAALFATVTRSLAERHFGVTEPKADPFPEGATVLVDDHLIIYRHTNADLVIGPAMLAASKKKATKVSILVGDAATVGIAARHASQLDPSPEVYLVEGTEIVPAEVDVLPEVAQPSMDEIELARADTPLPVDA